MSTQAQDARHVPLSKVDRLRLDAEEAAQVRALITHPAVIALRIERARSFVAGLYWVGMGLALAFTMVNVQQFAAVGATSDSLRWWAAWLLDPMVSLFLIAGLLGEQITARYQVVCGPWVRSTKVFAFIATYVMNTWESWAVLDPAGIFLHSVPPVMVLAGAEVGPHMRERITQAVLVATGMIPPPHSVNTPGGVPNPVADPFTTRPAQRPVNGLENTPPNTSPPVHEPTAGPVRERPPRATKNGRNPSRKTPPRRRLADYVAEARPHLKPGVMVTPAWVRSVIPGCPRSTSKHVADALNQQLQDDRSEVTA